MNESDFSFVDIELLIVGCGEDGAGDDAVGLEIVRRVSSVREEKRFSAPGEATASLRSVASGHPYLLFVDAVSMTSLPGTVHLLSLPNDEIRPRNLDPAAVPPGARAALLGIEIGSVAPGPLSEAVANAADFVVANIDALERQVLLHEHEKRAIALRVLAPERELAHA